MLRKLCFILFMGLSITAQAELQLEVFLAQAQPVEILDAFETTVFILDDRTRVMEALNQNLPSDPDEAEAYAKQLIEQQGDSLASRIAQAERGHFLKNKYDLKRFPAFVFDQEFISEGSTLDEALEEYEQWLSE